MKKFILSVLLSTALFFNSLGCEDAFVGETVLVVSLVTAAVGGHVVKNRKEIVDFIRPSDDYCIGLQGLALSAKSQLDYLKTLSPPNTADIQAAEKRYNEFNENYRKECVGFFSDFN